MKNFTTEKEDCDQKSPPSRLISSYEKIDPWWWLVVAVVALVIVLITLKPDPYKRIFIFVQDGIFVTLYVTFISFFLVLILGLIGGLGRISHNRILYGIASIYVDVVRGIPILVQLIFWYFAMPAIIQDIGRLYNISVLANYRPDAMIMAIFGLTFCYAAYMSEVYRAGFESIPKGQMEAARSLGMSYIQSMRYVIIPQAFRVILPPVGNEFVTLLKDSSLISIVAVADMTRRGREFMATNFIPVQTWVMIALLYLVMTLVASRVVSWLETKSHFER